MMGFLLMRFITSFLMLCCLREIKAGMDMINSSMLLDDDMIQEYARNSLPRRPQTGVLYNVSTLPSNFTGIQVSIVRLRRDSFWGRGANYSGFNIPPKIFTLPSFTRLDLVFSNLGNQSSYYYNYNLQLPNYTLVAPVVGFNAYGSTREGQIGNLTATPVTKLNLTLFGGPILVHFPNISVEKEIAKYCVVFHTNGTFEMTNMSLENTCAVRDQGHFSIVIHAESSIIPEEKKKGKKKLWKWWVFGFAAGVVGLSLLLLLGFILIRTLRMNKIRKMEKQAEKNEVLEATNVGPSKMPLAAVVRTQPLIENDYVP